MKRILVTGGTGFIGSNLSLRLVEAGYSVRILRRETSDLRTIRGTDVEQFVGDVRDLESVRRAVAGCDTVFHTAAVVTFVRKMRELQQEVIVSGTSNVVEACLAEGVGKLIVTSSIAAIGHPSEGELATEETPFNWPRTTGYKFSKYQAERHVLDAAGRGLTAVIVNPSVVIGERDIHFHGGELVKEARQGRLLFYPEGGMNVVYVGDIVNGHILAAHKGLSGQRYILGGHNMTHQEIFRRTAALVGARRPLMKLPTSLLRFGARVIEAAGNLTGIDPPVSSDLVAGTGLHNWYSSEKAQRELGYTITPFDTMIIAAYRWYQENGLL